MLKTLSGRLQELKNKGKVQLDNPKSCRTCLRELFITKFKSQFKRGFTKVVVTKAGCLRRVVARRVSTENQTRENILYHIPRH